MLLFLFSGYFEFFIGFLVFLWLLILFGFSLLVFKNYFNLVILFEVLMVIINLLFIVIGLYLDDLNGQIFVLFNLGVIGCESALGLILLVLYWQFNNSLALSIPVMLKG
jgi:NADH:ubiquinone oxidoreductase subunit K